LLDIVFLILSIILPFKNITYLAIFLPTLFLYPFILEPIYLLIFKIKKKLFSKDWNHADLHLNFANKNNICYHDDYNIKVFGLEKKSPFDSMKYKRTLDKIG